MKNRTIALANFCWLAALIAIRADVCLAENWPYFRGPTRQGMSPEQGVPLQWSSTSNVAWKTPIPGEGWSSPIVYDDRVYVTTATDGGVSYRLLCLDRRTGAVLWNKQVLQQKAGHKQRFNSYASSTPATDGENVYAVASDGSIAAISKEGAIRWMNRDYEFFSEHGLAVSPVLYEDLVIVAFDGSSPGPDTKLGWQKPWDKAVIVALDKNTGKVRWEGKRGLSRIAHVTPQILSENFKDQIISSDVNVVQGFDITSVRRIW
ncbi:MAG: PQQ-binding-like beta-propeller repeat protein, partial [Sedimentisphaerales bacterium]